MLVDETPVAGDVLNPIVKLKRSRRAVERFWYKRFVAVLAGLRKR
jgi:hypothetical protein